MRAPALSALTLVFASAASAQDVEMLGRRYGTRPPDAYYERIARDPDAFSFAHGRAVRLREAIAGMRQGAEPGAGAFRGLGPPTGPVTGTLALPVVLGLFSDSPDADLVPYGGAEIGVHHFGDDPGTVAAYYDEVSGGRLALVGEVYDWVRTDRTRAQATGGVSGLDTLTTGPYVTSILERLAGVDWAPYDDDGPDGVPNSGDDDGRVDALAVFHPTHGAECGGSGQDDRIWSHKWSLTKAGPGPFETTTPAFNGGFIRVDDYFIQGVLSCDQASINEIGVFAHETGHAFGLPDLYNTINTSVAGAGSWDLMATGGWGCNDRSPATPCHMGAWSKSVLGWVDVTVVTPGTDHGTVTLPAVETTGDVLRVDAGDGSGEYFLLENRQPIGFDSLLHREGLLVWQIDPDWVDLYWPANEVNARAHMGVWLRQADGSNQLGASAGGRGDSGDPYPFVHPSRGNDDFHAVSVPSSRSYGGAGVPQGSATGVTLLDVERVGEDVRFRLLTRFSTVALSSEGDEGNGGLFRVGGQAVAATDTTYTAAPFDPVVVEAAAADPIADGIRRPFERWEDDSAATHVRAFPTPLVDTSLVALYGARQIELGMEITGGQGGIDPGVVATTPDSQDRWFEEGVSVSVQAVPDASFAFTAWTGDFSGRQNPTTVTMDTPVRAGAAFALTYRLATDTIHVTASEPQALTLAVEDGTAPFSWGVSAGALPAGLSMDTEGDVTGAAVVMGTFPVSVTVSDAVGLRVQGEVVFEITRPDIPLSQLASPFLLVGAPPTEEQRRFLDHQGNHDGGYDLGDVRAWVLANPDLSFDGELAALLTPRTVILRAVRGPGGGR